MIKLRWGIHAVTSTINITTKNFEGVLAPLATPKSAPVVSKYLRMLQ